VGNQSRHIRGGSSSELNNWGRGGKKEKKEKSKNLAIAQENWTTVRPEVGPGVLVREKGKRG